MKLSRPSVLFVLVVCAGELGACYRAVSEQQHLAAAIDSTIRNHNQDIALIQFRRGIAHLKVFRQIDLSGRSVRILRPIEDLLIDMWAEKDFDKKWAILGQISTAVVNARAGVNGESYQVTTRYLLIRGLDRFDSALTAYRGSLAGERAAPP